MTRIEEVLRLTYEIGCSQREVGRACGLSQSAVSKLLKRARKRGLSWPLPEGLGEAGLQEQLYGKAAQLRGRRQDAEPDFANMHEELRGKGKVTLRLLWEEYQALHRQGYGYSHFCDLYKQWRKSLDVVMRQEHRAGEKLFVDFAGEKVTVWGPAGEREAQLFVAALGASSYTYAEAVWAQDLENWTLVHVRALEWFQGSPRILVPDNLKAAVTRAHRYEPKLNRIYHAMARHYSMAVVPARAAKPRDKAKVEAAVLQAERRILAVLRHERFGSLGELNAAVRVELDKLNERPFQKRPDSRASLFRKLDRPALQPLPRERFEHAEWHRARVHPDHHVVVEGHYYSAPCQLVHELLDVRLTASCVELLHQGRRVAVHARSWEQGEATTLEAHRPRAHREQGAWPPERIEEWAHKTGPHTGQLVHELLAGSRYPQEQYRPSLGIIRLGKRYGGERLEAAAQRALHFGAVSYRGVQRILESGKDGEELPGEAGAGRRRPLQHANVRGGSYYAANGGGGEAC